LEGSGHDLIKVPTQHLPGGVEENYEKPQPGYLVSQPGFEQNTTKIEV
jgi:hypothetical protein